MSAFARDSAGTHDPTLPVPSIVTGGGLDTPAAHLGEGEVRQLAIARYGLDGAFTRFATEKDDTFRILTADGPGFVLKVANPAEKEGEIDFQLGLLEHVERAAPGLPLPRVQRDLSGRRYSFYAARDGTERIVRVVSYLDGIPLDRTETSAPQRALLGAALARLRLATASFRHEWESRELAWDVQHLLKLEPLLAQVDDAEQRVLLARALERFARISGALATARRQVLHNDVNKSNVVVDPAAAQFITGIIDFGDAVRTATAVDVSTTLCSFLPERPAGDPFGQPRDIVRGYLSVADLSDAELALIPHLVMGRCTVRALLTLWRAKFFPQNADYILRNTAQGWWQLRWFLARSADEIGECLLTVRETSERSAANRKDLR